MFDSPVAWNQASPARPEPTLVTIGDMSCSRNWVSTPSGYCPIQQASWTFTDMTRTTTGIPAYAIVLAVLFFVFCLLGLLFLLIKEERTSGWAQVTVQGPGLLHITQLPISSAHALFDVNARVNYARSLTMAR